MTFKSYFPKAISIIFTFQFVLLRLFASINRDPSFIYWAIFLILPLGILLYLGNLNVELNQNGIKLQHVPFCE